MLLQVLRHPVVEIPALLYREQLPVLLEPVLTLGFLRLALKNIGVRADLCCRFGLVGKTFARMSLHTRVTWSPSGSIPSKLAFSCPLGSFGLRVTRVAADLSLVRRMGLFRLERAVHLLFDPLILCHLISHLFLEVLLVDVVVPPGLGSCHRRPGGLQRGPGPCRRQL